MCCNAYLQALASVTTNRFTSTSYDIVEHSDVIDELRSRVCISNPLLVALTESLLNSDVTDSDIKLSNYICYRDDRCGRRGGGVILYIHYSIVAVLLEAKSYDDVETL
ncbi:hypothetical protein GJ496_010738 [Pomphorhynchus laevis]|nr:hypothetical protein GJ496_010738 [Pomphorhynchus laevis]